MASREVLTTDAVQSSDLVITMGCGAGQGVEAVRPIRDAIEHHIRGLSL